MSAAEGRARARHAGEGEAPDPRDAPTQRRSGIWMLYNVQQKTIKPLILVVVSPGTTVYTDEYDIYARLPEWGYGHKALSSFRPYTMHPTIPISGH